MILKQVSHSPMKLNSLAAKAREICYAYLNVGGKENLRPLERDVVSLSQEAKPTYESCNLVHHDATNISEIVPRQFARKKYRIATSGYSFAMEGYDNLTFKFLQALDRHLGSRNTAYVAPPALDPKNIYDMTTRVSGISDGRILYLTCNDYLPFLKPENFSKEVNLRKFLKQPIHVLPDPKTYTDATTKASNVLICTGGRDDALKEIVSALKQKHKVLLIINGDMSNGVFNNDKGMVENAAKYFADITNPNRCKENHPIVDNLDVEWLKAHPSRIHEFVRTYYLDNGSFCTPESAAERAARFIKDDFCTYNYIPEDELNRMAKSVI